MRFLLGVARNITIRPIEKDTICEANFDKIKKKLMSWSNENRINSGSLYFFIFFRFLQISLLFLYTLL